MLIIPDELHIPVTNLEWIPSDTKLAYSSSTEHLSVDQRTILDAMISLFNALDKVRVIGLAHARHSLNADPELLALIQRGRPRFNPTRTAKTAGRLGDSPAATVVRSRLRQGPAEGEKGPIGYFMPMIDLLNHHPYGSRYERTPEGHWLIRVHHPGPTAQVYVRYNAVDALGIALGLGYAETATRFVSSVACQFRLANVGLVRVAGVNGRLRRIPAPQVTFDDEGMLVEPVLLSVERLAALRALLAMPLLARSTTAEASAAQVDAGLTAGRDAATRLGPASDAATREADRTAIDLISAVVYANVDFYRELRDLCGFAGRGDSELRRLFAAVADHQLSLLQQVSAELLLLGLD